MIINSQFNISNNKRCIPLPNNKTQFYTIKNSLPDSYISTSFKALSSRDKLNKIIGKFSQAGASKFSQETVMKAAKSANKITNNALAFENEARYTADKYFKKVINLKSDFEPLIQSDLTATQERMICLGKGKYGFAINSRLYRAEKESPDENLICLFLDDGNYSVEVKHPSGNCDIYQKFLFSDSGDLQFYTHIKRLKENNKLIQSKVVTFNNGKLYKYSYHDDSKTEWATFDDNGRCCKYIKKSGGYSESALFEDGQLIKFPLNEPISFS